MSFNLSTSSPSEETAWAIRRLAETGRLCCASARWRNRQPGDVFSAVVSDDGRRAKAMVLRRISEAEFAAWIGVALDREYADSHYFYEVSID